MKDIVEREIKHLAKDIEDIICVDCEYKEDVSIDKATSLYELGWRKQPEVIEEVTADIKSCLGWTHNHNDEPVRTINEHKLKELLFKHYGVEL